MVCPPWAGGPLLLPLPLLPAGGDRTKTKMWRNVQALCRISQRTISTASRRQLENRVSENQKLFQEDNGLPVHLKGGAKDSLLYRTTAGLTLLGTMYTVYYLLVSSMPKKPN